MNYGPTIIIHIDDLRGDALSCTGHPFVNTPSIDRIALEGAIFRNAFVTTPLCLPNRASSKDESNESTFDQELRKLTDEQLAERIRDFKTAVDSHMQEMAHQVAGQDPQK